MIKNFLDFSKCHIRVSGGDLKLKGIVRINLASSGEKMELIGAVSQDFMLTLMRLQTIDRLHSEGLGVWGLNEEGKGNHGSSQTRMFKPLPTCQWIPREMMRWVE